MSFLSFQDIVVIVTSRTARADFEEAMSKECGQVAVLAPTSPEFSGLGGAEAEDADEQDRFEETETEMGNYSILFLLPFFFH
jgi:hypothetical protein